MKKTLLATAVASVVTFGMANAATVYENEGFKLNLDGSLEAGMSTTFGYYEAYNLNSFKGKEDALKKYFENARKTGIGYKPASFSGYVKGSLTTKGSYQVNEGFAVGGGFTFGFNSVPNLVYDDPAETDPAEKRKITSVLQFKGANISFGGTSILGKVTLGNRDDAIESYVNDLGYTGANLNEDFPTSFSGLASISYEMGPIMGLNVLVGASLPLRLETDFSTNINPKSTSGYTLGVKYDLELDKDMFVKVGLGYTTATENTKAKNPLDSKQYANWKHEFGLATAFETEMFGVGLGYKLNFSPAYNNGKKGNELLSVRTPFTHNIGFKADITVLEGLNIYTKLNAKLKEASNHGGNLVLVKADDAIVKALGKSKASTTTDLGFVLGVKYTIAKGLSTAVEVGTKTKFTHASTDKDGKVLDIDNNEVADDAKSAQTAPSLKIKLNYKF